MNQQIDISDLSCIYLSYDEPQREEFWARIKDNIPWAERVDGVHGSDKAHKAAALKSDTERFILIDGDNLPDWSFFNQTLTIDASNNTAQFRWRAKNSVNDLYYGNGGMSCWTREFVLNMKTHENTEGQAETNIEFCFDPMYWAMNDSWSTTYINYTAKQAWRAGFREGVKLCTRSGVVPRSNSDFLNWVWPRNLKNLKIWQTIGRDIENGFWSILGARTGTYYLMLNKSWDHTDVRDFEKLDQLWELHSNDDEHVANKLLKDLNLYLGLDLTEFDSYQSKFIKDNINQSKRNQGIMIREIDIIRAEEGW